MFGCRAPRGRDTRYRVELSIEIEQEARRRLFEARDRSRISLETPRGRDFSEIMRCRAQAHDLRTELDQPVITVARGMVEDDPNAHFHHHAASAKHPPLAVRACGKILKMRVFETGRPARQRREPGSGATRARFEHVDRIAQSGWGSGQANSGKRKPRRAPSCRVCTDAAGVTERRCLSGGKCMSILHAQDESGSGASVKDFPYPIWPKPPRRSRAEDHAISERREGHLNGVHCKAAPASSHMSCRPT